jgi:hypothetical protein
MGTKKFETNSHVKSRQRFEVLQRTPRTDVTGIKIGDKEMKFGKKSRAFFTDDAGLAHAIHDTQGQGGTGDVLVIPVEKPQHPNHSRTWHVPALPWHKEKKDD